MTGRVQFFLSLLASAMNLAKERKVQAIGVTSTKRVSQLPDIPTVAESGLPGYRWDFWYGMLAPAKTPRPLIARLNGEITRILGLPDVRQRWSALGAEPAPSTPEQFDKLITDEIVTNIKLARAANIKAE